ncbi:hypothetical protein D1007_12046 [Hordeum vulgare]|nr:hypothetical protein D1007_12046 [Hordeum vulgare]
MADARYVRAECRAARVVMTAHASPSTRLHSAEAKSAPIDPAAREQQASSMHPSVQQEGRTAIASSHAHPEWVNTQAALLMAGELLRYYPMDAEAWLGRITELVAATREAQAPSRLLCPPPSHDGEEAQGAPLPPPAHGDQAVLRRDACPGNRPQKPPPPSQEEGDSCQIILYEAPLDTGAVLEQQRQRVY